VTQGVRFPYLDIDPAHPGASRLPYVPLTLAHDQLTLALSGLLDTGATVNVLPYPSGLQLGLNWTQQTTPIQLTGNFSPGSRACRGALSNNRVLAPRSLGIRLDTAHHRASAVRPSQLLP
jgi:hypothetical protein